MAPSGACTARQLPHDSARPHAQDVALVPGACLLRRGSYTPHTTTTTTTTACCFPRAAISRPRGLHNTRIESCCVLIAATSLHRGCVSALQRHPASNHPRTCHTSLQQLLTTALSADCRRARQGVPEVVEIVGAIRPRAVAVVNSRSQRHCPSGDRGYRVPRRWCRRRRRQ